MFGPIYRLIIKTITLFSPCLPSGLHNDWIHFTSETCDRHPELPQREDQPPRVRPSELRGARQRRDSRHTLTFTPCETCPLREEFRGPASPPREEIASSSFLFDGVDDDEIDEMEVVLGDKLYMETFDCLG